MLITIIKSKTASRWELENIYTLDDALKLYTLIKIDSDIQMAHANESKEKTGRRR